MLPVYSLCSFSVPEVNTRHHVAFGQQSPQSPPAGVIFVVFLLFFPTKITISLYAKISQISAYQMTQPNGIKIAESHNGLCAISVNVQSQLMFM